MLTKRQRLTLDSPVTDLPVKTRIRNLLATGDLCSDAERVAARSTGRPRQRIASIGDLLQLRQVDVLRVEGFGRKPLADIEPTLAKYGWTLQPCHAQTPAP